MIIKVCKSLVRWYDPTVGRWLSKDPIGISGGLNQYVFVENCPIMYRDPLGLFWSEIGKGLNGACGVVFGNKSGDIFTFGLSGGAIIPVGPVPIPLGVALSFDRVIMNRGHASWFFTMGFGASTPGISFAADRGRTDAKCSDSYVGSSVSINVDLAPIGYEAGAPGWDPSGWVDKLFFGKGGFHIGEGINLIWNWTWDIGE